MSIDRLVSGVRTGRRTLHVALVATLLVTSAFAGGAFAGDGGSPGDAPDERQNAQQLEAGETIEGNLSDGDDVDWYAVNATAGEAVVATLGLLNASGNRSVEINVYGPSGERGTEVEQDKMSGPQRVAGKRPGSSEETTAEAPDVAEETGTYYVEVRESPWNETDEGVTSPYNITVTTEPLDEYDPNENGSTATPLEVGQSIEGVMAPYDHDVFAVNLTEGQNYTVTFNLTNAPAGRYSKAMTIHTNASAVTDDDPAGGTLVYEMVGNASGNYTAEENGTHYLRLGQSGVTATLLERAPYRLTITRTDSSTDDGTDDGADDGTGDGTDGGTEDDGTSGGGDARTDASETPDSDSPEPLDAGLGEDTTSGTETTDVETESSTDGEATAAETETTVRGGGGGSGDATATGSPTEADGPGFGVAFALVSLLTIALLGTRASPL